MSDCRCPQIQFSGYWRSVAISAVALAYRLTANLNLNLKWSGTAIIINQCYTLTLWPCFVPSGQRRYSIRKKAESTREPIRSFFRTQCLTPRIAHVDVKLERINGKNTLGVSTNRFELMIRAACAILLLYLCMKLYYNKMRGIRLGLFWFLLYMYINTSWFITQLFSRLNTN